MSCFVLKVPLCKFPPNIILYHVTFLSALRVAFFGSPTGVGLVQVMENLESHGIDDFNFRDWKVMEF